MNLKYIKQNTEEGVADKVYQTMGIPGEFDDFDKQYVKSNNEDNLLGVMKKRWDDTYFKDPVYIYKNPNTTKNFIPTVRGVILNNGDLYLGNAYYFLHQDLIPYMSSKGLIKNDKNIKFLDILSCE